KLTICARAGNRAGHFCVRMSCEALAAQADMADDFGERSKLESDGCSRSKATIRAETTPPSVLFPVINRKNIPTHDNQNLCIGNNFRLGSGRRLVQVGPELSPWPAGQSRFDLGDALRHPSCTAPRSLYCLQGRQ